MRIRAKGNKANELNENKVKANTALSVDNRDARTTELKTAAFIDIADAEESLILSNENENDDIKEFYFIYLA